MRKLLKASICLLAPCLFALGAAPAAGAQQRHEDAEPADGEPEEQRQLQWAQVGDPVLRPQRGAHQEAEQGREQRERAAEQERPRAAGHGDELDGAPRRGHRVRLPRCCVRCCVFCYRNRNWP